MKKIPLFIIGALLTTPTMAANYYVAKTGNDNNSGTLTAPWLTIQKAANTVQAGDKVYIKTGIYKEKVIMRQSGTASKWITFSAYGKNKGLFRILWDRVYNKNKVLKNIYLKTYI